MSTSFPTPPVLNYTHSPAPRPVADNCTGAYVNALGMGFDASGLLGNTRSSRFVAVVEDCVVKSVVAEKEAPTVGVTAAEKVLESL